MNKIYKLTITTSNPSADKNGFFLTLEEAENVKSKWEKIIEEDNKLPQDEQYYGESTFEIRDIGVGESYFD